MDKKEEPAEDKGEDGWREVKLEEIGTIHDDYDNLKGRERMLQEKIARGE